ncbi:GtrA family protein [Polluticoccus soli]|uniref:GtrA family protein n=1 Tax=Polluticoccus soli TaxID=3034150 RepID=UPI0023E0A40A|nr:GtrA family protein [Flavipsychrobacter sp. JY13-12]
MLSSAKNIVLAFIDFFHAPFSRWINLQTFRYLACGGTNTVLGIFLYWLCYHHIVEEQAILIGGLTITPHISAFLLSFSISFPAGFILAKYVVFPESNLKGRIQLFRYALLVGMCVLLNYIFLKIFVEWFGLYPTLAYVLTNAIVAVFSYISQRNFTFKVKEVDVVAPDYIEIE